MIEVCALCGSLHADDPDDLDYFEDIEYCVCEYCIMEMANPFYFEEIEMFNFLFSNDDRFDNFASDALEMMT